MRRALAALALLAGTLAAAPSIAAPEGFQRVWRVRWSDPNPGPIASRVLEVQRRGVETLELALYQRVQHLDDGSEFGMGWLEGGPTDAAPEVRGRLVDVAGEVPPSVLSGWLVLSESVVMADPVPEPGVGAGLLAGIVGLLLLRR